MKNSTNADKFMFFADLMLLVFEGLERGATVTKYVSTRSNLNIEFEVRIVKLGGKALPRTNDMSTAPVRGK